MQGDFYRSKRRKQSEAKTLRSLRLLLFQGFILHSTASRRAKAVATNGVIRPLGIAEITRAAGERVGLRRNPGGIGQSAGFHHNDQIAGSGDGEPKTVCPHAKARVAGFRLRVP
jgi:hypothetical protein